MLMFKTCKIFQKTFEKSSQQVKTKFKDFINQKSDDPMKPFGSSDYGFRNDGHFRGLKHAKLTFDVSIVYRIESNICYLYGVFSHDELGTGQPANISKQKSMGTKLAGQEFK